ncbi:hypothetical protein T459_31745 [Capsicum annuum]|uniref:TF-B3 domain-containing protein n=2 Tax=Capsicum annuum TaxID=4072 RepID=A0A2G2Y3T1_CAPAN|nr:hypothetical protein T459_31745 [Capsicum annuum]
MKKGFFKVFNPETSAKRLKILTSFTNSKNGKLPRKVFLRDRFDNMWPMGVTKTGRDFYFEYKWEKFIEDNSLELGDFLVFDFDGNRTFYTKLLGKNGCEKKEAGGLKLTVEEEEEINEHHNSVEPKGKNLASDNSSSSSDDDDSVEDYVVDEKEKEDEEYEEEEEEEEKEEEETEEAARSKRKRMVEEEHDDDEEEETEAENEEENQRVDTFEKKVSRSKAGCKRVATRKVRDLHDHFDDDIFKSGWAAQPKNPYFVAKIRSSLYVPVDLVRDCKLELPSSMIIRDSAGREFETECKTDKQGKTWLRGGWDRLCKWNLVEENDKCIWEFVRGKHNKVLYIQVQVLREGSSCHPDKKNKK